jgi:hypothetical protein
MPDTTPLAPVKVPHKGRKGRLVTLADLDQRTRAAQRVNDVMGAIESDLGGSDHLSTAQRVLIQRCAVMAAIIEDQEARFARGEPIDIGPYTTLVNSLRRVLADLGLERRSRDVTMDLATYVRERYGQPDDVIDGEVIETGWCLSLKSHRRCHAAMSTRIHNGTATQVSLFEI